MLKNLLNPIYPTDAKIEDENYLLYAVSES